MKPRTIQLKSSLAVILGILAVGLLFGYGLKGFSPSAPQAAPRENPISMESGTRQVYVCPMMCVPPMEKEGKCPICGMELVAVSAGHGHEKPGASQLKLSPDAARLAQIQTAPVERRFVEAEVRLFGRIDYDPAHISKITAFMPGVIDRVYVKRPGVFVRWGDPLFDLYSSDLLATQQQLVEALRYVPSFLAFQADTPHVAREVPVQAREKSEDPGHRTPEAENAVKTIGAIRHKLSVLGLPKRDIDQLMRVGEATGVATVYAPMYGQIIQQNAFEGAFINKGIPVFTIADPLYVWARLNVYESDFPWIRTGQRVMLETDAYPGEVFEGKVINIDPVFDTGSRTFSVGAIVAEDQSGRLKAGMVVRAVILSKLDETGKVLDSQTAESSPPLVIPASAPLITGRRSVVYVAAPGEEGLFEGREVLLGPKAKGYYIVREGLTEGEQVVVNGNFKIDSAVQILAGSGMMGIEGGDRADAHHRPGDSRQLQESYMSERIKSRQQRVPDSEQGDPQTGTRLRQEAGARPEPGGRTSGTILRRRPGAYGDSTRRALPQGQ